MNLSEKIANLRKLTKKADLKAGSAEEKLFLAFTDVLEDVSKAFDRYNAALDDMSEALDDLEESVCDLEDEIYGDDGISDYGDFGEFEDDAYEITCAACDKTITADYDVLDNGAVTCPGCGELIEFTIEYEEYDD